MSNTDDYDFAADAALPFAPSRPRRKALRIPSPEQLLDMDPAERAEWEDRMQDTPSVSPWWQSA